MDEILKPETHIGREVEIKFRRNQFYKWDLIGIHIGGYKCLFGLLWNFNFEENTFIISCEICCIN